MSPATTMRAPLAIVLLVVSSLWTSAAAAHTEQVCFDVALRGGTTEVCADVHENDGFVPWGATLLAVHGFTETAQTWAPLANALFEHPALRYAVKRVVAIDLPGHGASPPPVDLPGGLFGDLTIHDNVGVIIQAIDILDGLGLGARTLVGHSMGGLAIQGVQEALLAGGSSLADHGIYRAILLAPVPADGQQWTQPPPSDLSPFVVGSAELGVYLDLPPFIAQIGGGFTTWEGTLVPGTPSVEEMVAYVGLEPITTALQLVGQIPLPRPTAREGAFALHNGTLLTLVSFSQDVLVPADDLDDLYIHLVGRRGFGYRPVDTPEAVHSMHVTDPAGLLDELADLPFAF